MSAELRKKRLYNKGRVLGFVRYNLYWIRTVVPLCMAGSDQIVQYSTVLYTVYRVRIQYVFVRYRWTVVCSWQTDCFVSNSNWTAYLYVRKKKYLPTPKFADLIWRKDVCESNWRWVVSLFILYQAYNVI